MVTEPTRTAIPGGAAHDPYTLIDTALLRQWEANQPADIEHGNLCPDCDGGGFYQYADVIADCPVCHGEGEVFSVTTELDTWLIDLDILRSMIAAGELRSAYCYRYAGLDR